MKSLNCIVLLLIFFLPGNVAKSQTSHKSLPPHCLALVLKINGTGKDVYSAEPFNYTFFSGRIKENYIKKSSSDINIIVQDENSALVFDGYFENPLSQLVESYEPDGSIKRIETNRQSEYLNLRFHIDENVKKIFVKCYQLVPGHDNLLISEFKMDLQ